MSEKKDNFWLWFVLFWDLMFILSVGILLNEELQDRMIRKSRAQKENYIGRIVGFSQYAKYRLVDVQIEKDTFKIVDLYWPGIYDKVRLGDTIVKKQGEEQLNIIRFGQKVATITFSPKYSNSYLILLGLEVLLIIAFLWLLVFLVLRI